MVASYKKYEKLRNDAGLIDYEVAKRSGVATATLSSWKSEIYHPKLDKIASIAQALGCQIGDLIEDPTENE